MNFTLEKDNTALLVIFGVVFAWGLEDQIYFKCILEMKKIFMMQYRCCVYYITRHFIYARKFSQCNKISIVELCTLT